MPDPDGTTRINELFQQMIGVINLTPQSDQIEWDTHTITPSTTSTPQFSIPASTIDAVTVYHHIGVRRNTNPSGASNWFVELSYPGLAAGMRVIDAVVDETVVGDMIAAGSLGGNSRIHRRARPLIVWPFCSIVIQRTATVATGELCRCSYVRQVMGGPGSANMSSDLTGGFL